MFAETKEHQNNDSIGEIVGVEDITTKTNEPTHDKLDLHKQPVAKPLVKAMAEHLEYFDQATSVALGFSIEQGNILDTLVASGNQPIIEERRMSVVKRLHKCTQCLKCRIVDFGSKFVEDAHFFSNNLTCSDNPDTYCKCEPTESLRTGKNDKLTPKSATETTLPTKKRILSMYEHDLDGLKRQRLEMSKSTSSSSNDDTKDDSRYQSPTPTSTRRDEMVSSTPSDDLSFNTPVNTFKSSDEKSLSEHSAEQSPFSPIPPPRRQEGRPRRMPKPEALNSSKVSELEAQLKEKAAELEKLRDNFQKEMTKYQYKEAHTNNLKKLLNELFENLWGEHVERINKLKDKSLARFKIDELIAQAKEKRRQISNCNLKRALREFKPAMEEMLIKNNLPKENTSQVVKETFSSIYKSLVNKQSNFF